MIEHRSLPRPPGARLAMLPREPDGKPQETAVAVNPRDPRNVIVSYHETVGEGSDHHPDVKVNARVAWTADGGETWTVADNLAHENYRVSIDATVTFDSHGHAFLGYIAMDEMSQTTRHGEYVGRSLDGGRTWEGPIPLIEHPTLQEPLFEHIPHIVADNHAESPYAGNLYACWTRNYFSTERKDEILLARSTDCGKTWSEPRVISTDGSSIMARGVAQDGTLYMMSVSFGPDMDPSWAQGWEVLLRVSRDGGKTFEAPHPVVRPGRNLNPNPGVGPGAAYEFPRAFGWPVMALDPRGAGRPFVVWGDYRNGDRDIFVTTSGDQGRTWTPPVRVNDDPVSNGKDQLMQFAAVDPSDGAVYVLFYDRRDDPENKLPAVTLARSSDGGRTFVNYAWSDTRSDPTHACFGDYIGLDALHGRVYGAWVESMGRPKKAPETVVSGTMVLEAGAWPAGPSAIRIGIADFRTTSYNAT